MEIILMNLALVKDFFFQTWNNLMLFLAKTFPGIAKYFQGKPMLEQIVYFVALSVGITLMLKITSKLLKGCITIIILFFAIALIKSI